MRKFRKLFSLGLIFGAILVLSVLNIDVCFDKSCRHNNIATELRGIPNQRFPNLEDVWATEVPIRMTSRLESLCRPQPRKFADCKALYRGENVTTSSNFPNVLEACRLENIVKNCSLLRLVHGYTAVPVTQEEMDFPLAFSVKVHTNPRQVEQLLRTIYRPQNVYCIHVDRKAEPTTHQILNQMAECFDNVHVIRHPINLVYASFDHVRVERQLMRLCLRHGKTWKYYINLAGQDFPLKTNLEMVQILKQLQGQNDIESFILSRHKLKNLLRKVKVVNGGLVTTNEAKENFIYNLEFRKGSTYGIFSRPFVRFLLEDDVAQMFFNWSRDITPSEEIVWPTLNALPWAPGGYVTEIRHIDGFHLAKAILWSLDSDSCWGKVVRSVCVFGANDLPWLKDRHELFANKFNDEYDSVPLDCLEETLRQRAMGKDTNHLQWFRYRHLRQVFNNQFQRIVSQGKSRAEYFMAEKQKWLLKQQPVKQKNIYPD